jgi:hypothetical protein
MPFFEFNAFRAAGIKDLFPFWRKGDFAIFRKVHDEITDRPKLIEKNANWVEKEINSIRIRVRVENNKDKNSLFKINHLVKGDILPTVSTRDTRRNEANIWTSGNRIFKVTNSKKFIELLDNLNNKKTKSKELKEVDEFVSTIAELEKKEYNNYLDWLYHEMERQNN